MQTQEKVAVENARNESAVHYICVENEVISDSGENACHTVDTKSMPNEELNTTLLKKEGEINDGNPPSCDDYCELRRRNSFPGCFQEKQIQNTKVLSMSISEIRIEVYHII